MKKFEESSDMKFVACAIAAGVKVVSFEKDSSTNQITWYLEKSDLLSRIDREYFAGTLNLPVRILFYHWDILKTQTNTHKKYEHE